MTCLQKVYGIMKTTVPEKCFAYLPRNSKTAAVSHFPKLQTAILNEVYKLLELPKEVSACLFQFL